MPGKIAILKRWSWKMRDLVLRLEGSMETSAVHDSQSESQPRKRMHRLEMKLGLCFAAIAIAISALLTFALYQITVDWLREGLRLRIRDAVAIGAGRLDGEAFASLKDPAQEEGPVYRRLQGLLREIRDAGSDYRYVYTVRMSPDNRVLFVVDAEEDPELVSHLGAHYDDAGPVLRASFGTLRDARVEEEFYTDKWGTWLTGYATLPAPEGSEPIVLCMDLAAANVTQRERQFLWRALTAFAVSLPFSLITGIALGRRLARPIMALTHGAERIAAGNLDHVVPVRGRDETAALAEAFNTMTGKLSRSLDDLRRSEEELTKHRDNLEELVIERTQRLTAANERMSQDLKSAGQVQKAFLPRQQPDLPGVRFAWNITPCEDLAGDMLDIHKIDAHRVGVWVADVCGHGVAAAMVSVTLSRLLSTLGGGGDKDSPPSRDHPPNGDIVSPRDVASFLNESFPWDREAMRFITFLYGILDIETGEFHYVSAGHPGPLLVPATGDPRVLPMSPPAIGLLPDVTFTEHRITLAPADRLFLYTDGITETENAEAEEFGIERLTATLAGSRCSPLATSVESLLETLTEWRGETRPTDDLSLLAVELVHGDSETES